MKKLFLFLLIELKKINLFFVFCILILQILGLLALYSVTYGENIFLFKQQMLWLLLGWIVFFSLIYSKIEFISKALWPLFFINVFCLVLVFFVGKEAYHAKRWLDLSVFYYQPSETLKLILVLLVAKQLSKGRFGQTLTFKELIKFSTFILPSVVLVLLQPDLGTAGITLLVVVTLFLFNGIEKKTFISLMLICLVSGPLGWHFLLKPYQKSRIINFINPGRDPQGTGYNVIQSKIAIGSGQVFGKGFKQGTQNRLQFLPERHTDFIFCVISEEYGFIGSSFVLALFFFLIGFIFNLASDLRDRLNSYLCIGAGAFFLWHIVLNLAMTMGLFPVVGIPLPLLSYGGSHTVTIMAFLGLVGGIYRKKDLF